jgi:hypothetical protein
MKIQRYKFTQPFKKFMVVGSIIIIILLVLILSKKPDMYVITTEKIISIEKKIPAYIIDFEINNELNSDYNFYRDYYKKKSVFLSRDIYYWILKYSTINGISFHTGLSHAFIESGFNRKGVNYNYNTGGELLSIDRGLFGLNNLSFPGYTPSQLFDPETNIRLGCEHIKKGETRYRLRVMSIASFNIGQIESRRRGALKAGFIYAALVLKAIKELDKAFNERKT